MATKVSAFNTSGTNQRATTVVGLAFRSATDGELYVVEGDETGGLPVTVVSGGSSLTNVNLSQVAGATVLTDYGATTTTAQRVVANISVAGAAVAAGNPVHVTPGTGAVFAVSATALPLPTGAATEATLSSLNSKVTAVNTGAVVVASSALPTGASTEATLAALNAKVTAVDTGAVVVSSSALPTGAATETTLAGIRTRQDVVDHGATATAQRVAAQLGVGGAAADANSGAASANTLRTVLATRHEAAATPLASRPSNGTSFADFGAGATASTTLRTESNVALAGVAASTGTGASGTGVQRVVLANESSPRVGRSIVTTARNDYSSVNVTTGAWVQLSASLSAIVSRVQVFDSSGQTLEIGIGAAASETRLFIVPPGGIDIDAAIAASTRISIRAISATASSGEIDANFIGN